MWFLYSLLFALTTGMQNAYFKKKSIRINPILMAWSVLVVSSILFSPLLLFGIPHLDQAFWISVLGRLILDSLAFTLFIKAIHLSPLSLTTPMLSLQLVLMIATQFFINHLFPTPLGIVGIIVIVVGVYFLHFDHDTKHILSPFKAIAKEKGVMLIIIVAVLWSIVGALQKLAIDNSTPYFYTSFFQILWAICFTPVAYLADRKGFKKLLSFNMGIKVFPAGAFDAAQVFFQFLAYSLTLPVYVNAVGNSNIIFSSIFGWLFFKEKIKNHILPTLIILLGILFITLAQK